jgi:two-component system nitrogen regulation response regulator NtrX
MSYPREVVIVDDERDILEVLADVLRDEGYTPVVFRDGIEALTYLTEREPALLLTDLRLPSMSGEELITHVRSHYSPLLPVVVISGAATTEVVRRLSIQDVLMKPFELDTFLALVQRWAPLQ